MIGCPVCFQPCEDLSTSEGREVICLGCGHFRVDAALLSRLQSHMFQRLSARQRLAESRKLVPVPALTIADVDLLQPK
ncbi:hypothetical protein IB234_15065 [Pseudomonas sp. PDM16]|uniref:hypothetical protein n=1 Tax=Pseudomonas sp. PDM16 TaxID=2769292 RepID=UPI00178206FD|nr:hypothetical protein [Pseudomonas sp. PDM16]MBD9415881.1 hypothetical protein [Pseudomonas sp. PDM16]